MSGGKTAVDFVCSQRDQIPIALAVMISMGFLLLFSLVFISPADESFPILVMDAALIVGSTAFFLVTYYYCTKRAMDD